MRQVGIDYVTIGDVLARTIFSSDGKVLLGHGVVLSAGFITRLRDLGITAIYIQDERLADIRVVDLISERTRREAMQALKMTTDMIKNGRQFDGMRMKKSVSSVVEEVASSREVLINLIDIRSKENWLMSHSLSVSVLATVLGMNCGLEQKRLVELAMGAMLHDVGVTALPAGLLAKDEALYDAAEVTKYREHVPEGFNLLRRQLEVPLMSAHVAYQHHENVDGSGYPRGLKGHEIHLYGRIVAVADVYDRLVNKGRKRVLPHEACEILMGLTGRYLDQELVTMFLKSVATYPTGISVRLSTGEIGVVVGQNASLPMRPIVRVLEERRRVIDPKEYNLMKDMTLFITEVLQ
ncbi:HD-GYP domain-containing protein [Heliophilum fasciatum]|uniref:Metal dependent phosphohydrolase n=1 Tax=Heliophilum fasciatum TaxID=35700 RepID=A0A4R2RSL4_9FIRM|nr:HD domain-containing phosphohydrolase [Heliophilum fasciatum]MCW2277426.1 HD-GYP domain-containing protein (c-di-GMP phosphodiesterase class II) [Heliophilum fasciatum]TCP67262.1 metal dependent phosphohydrolase [Heliophilum fasciatum]